MQHAIPAKNTDKPLAINILPYWHSPCIIKDVDNHTLTRS